MSGNIVDVSKLNVTLTPKQESNRSKSMAANHGFVHALTGQRHLRDDTEGNAKAVEKDVNDGPPVPGGENSGWFVLVDIKSGEAISDRVNGQGDTFSVECDGTS